MDERDALARKSLDSLVELLAKDKWSVKFSWHESSATDWDTHTITINKNTTLPAQVVILLHEFGHVFLDVQQPTRTANGCVRMCGPRAKKNSVFIAGVLDEEVGAWEYAARIARMHSVHFEPKTFHRIKATSLASYVRWAARPHREV